MKRKITIALALLFCIFACGSLVAAYQIASTTALFKSLLKLHQIESLRHSLVQKTLKFQTELYTINPSLDQGLDSIIQSVDGLENTAASCFNCHHEAVVTVQLEEMQSLIQDFKGALSTASANKTRIGTLKSEAIMAGNRLLDNTEKLAFGASKKVNALTGEAMSRVDKAKIFLILVFILSTLVSIVIAVYLIRSITTPISALVAATRKIANGELGYVLDQPYPAEFGELRRNFNAMSTALKSSYDKLGLEISERKEAEEALRLSEERYALAARGANDGLWDWDLRTDAIYFSPRWLAMLGLDEDLGHRSEDWLSLVHPDDRGRLAAKINAHVDGFSTHLEDEHRILHQDGSYRWMLVRGLAVRYANSTACRMAGSQTDITLRKVTEERLVYDALHDALTGLPNRALFMDRLEHVLQMAKRRSNYRFAVLFLNLDRFKYINDSLGHLIGDQLLISVSRRLSTYLRPSDTVARLGGDEFAILLDDIGGEEDARKIAERIQGDLPLPLHIEEREVVISGSIGIALNNKRYERPDELLRDADLAMYQAKTNGKSRFEIFDNSMYASTLRHLQLETDLRQAIDRNEFHLVYQPIVSLRTDRITGVEALIRWEHPTLGLIGPEEFIPLAEETGLITPIGLWVLREACQQVSCWQKSFGPPLPTINVNLSCQEFTPALLEVIRELFVETGIAPSTLRLEITERTIMKNPESAAALLLQLRQLGVGLHIDDFGTGYSSLSYLHHFPVDTLKIDRSFIQKLHVEKDNSEIVKAIIALANSLQLQIVAEGVETREQLQAISNLGCDLVQGYFFHEPMRAEKIETLLAAQGQVIPAQRSSG
jgi:diguanylate cyclase (GGDEF)-like protein/PAS domain S-box-containing protein